MEYKLKDIGKIVTGKTPKTSEKENFSNKNDKYLFLTPKDMSGNDKYIRVTERFLTDNVTSKFSNIILYTKSVCISCIGSNMGKVFMIEKPTITNQQINSITTINENICNPEYLYYYFKDKKEYLKCIAGGSTMPILNKSTFENIDVDLPDIAIQNKIVKIVKHIDEKIELNNQTNDNLLELINNLYKESFSNIEEYKQADEIANITIGKTPPRSNRECFTYNEDDIKWLSISDLGKCGMYAWNTSEKLTEDAVNKYNVKVIPENTIVLSFKLTIGRIAITAKKMATNEAIAHFNLIDRDMIYYLYSYLKNFDYSKLGNTSSIATAVNSKIIKAMPISVPNKTMILEFNNKVKPLFEKIKLNEAQNETLTQLRDTLLPKLMNGEIDLDKIEI